MPRNYFTDEEINILKNNPYVLKVSKANVVFTEEFKKYFIAQYNYGIQPRDIFRSININPEILGNRRIGTITRRFKDQSVRPEGFSRKTNSSKGKLRKKKIPKFSSDNDRAEYYKEYSEKLEQEIELLKKIQALEEIGRTNRAKNLK